MKTVVSVVSARPNFVKVAAVHHALAAYGDLFRHLIVHTGQHYDPLFSDVFFQQLYLPEPAVNLGIAGGSREEVIAATDVAMQPVLREMLPDVVLVYGDVNGAVGAARAAKDVGIFLVHVEAGLRSFDKTMPEELNRREIDGLADILFCSEQSGMENLSHEGTKGERHLVGNVMIDTLRRMTPMIESSPPQKDVPASYGVVTIHRPSNVDDPDALRANIMFLNEVAEHLPLLLPAHHRFTHALGAFGLRDALSTSIRLLPPLGYIPFLALVRNAAFVLTDSGGIQEEAVLLQKRCFTLRRNTERPSTIESGSNVLIDPSFEEDRQTVLRYAADPSSVSIRIPPLWDGKTGERIAEVLLVY